MSSEALLEEFEVPSLFRMQIDRDQNPASGSRVDLPDRALQFVAYAPLSSGITTEPRKELSETEIRLEVEPEEPAEDVDPRACSFAWGVRRIRSYMLPSIVLLALNVTYPDAYPDVLPELSLEAIEGEITDEEVSSLLDEMKTVVCGHFVDFLAVRWPI